MLWARLFMRRSAGQRVLLEMDSSCSVDALWRAYSPVSEMFKPIVTIWGEAADAFVCLRISHVVGTLFNRVADALSHGQLDLARCLMRAEFGTELQLLDPTLVARSWAELTR
jgi:hypothetical protein